MDPLIRNRQEAVEAYSPAEQQFNLHRPEPARAIPAHR